MTTRTTTGTTTEAPRRRPGLAVRTQISLTVALLVATSLAGAGVVVYVIERERVERSVERSVVQELDEFGNLQQEGIDPVTGELFGVRPLLHRFLERNVPDEHELLVGWVDDAPAYWFPRHRLIEDPAFLSAAAPLVTEGGTTRIDTAHGTVRMTSQPVRQGTDTGALLVIHFLDEERAALNDTMRTYAVVALLALLLVTAAAHWQAGRLLRPLRTLRLAAEEIEATDLTRRIPETGNDDITALTRTVNAMLERLDTSFTEQRWFLDAAGHELRTPMTVLRGHLELLDHGDPEDVAATRDLLLDEAERMSRLVEDLILLAKSGRPDFLRLTEVRPAELVRSVFAKARGLGDREWILELADAPAGDVVLCDAQRLSQALLAHCDNAVKHTDPGGRITLGAACLGNDLRLWVCDSGAGVPIADRERIFERFSRARVPDGDEGFGLGLSVVAAIAKAHGGSVAVDDAPDGGARFVITVPAVRRAASASATGAEPPTQEVPAWHGS